MRLHPALDLAIPVAARRWRRAPLAASTWRGIADFRRALHARAYDEVIDTQGLFFKSALIARMARGRRHGYDAQSIKERAAAWLYDVRHRVERNQHAIARNRDADRMRARLCAGGRAGLRARPRANCASRRRRPTACCCTRPRARRKQWPEENWRSLAAALGTGIDLVVPCGTQAERERAHADRLGHRARARAGAPAARRHGAADRRRVVRGRGRHRPDASRGGARRAAGRDLHRAASPA